MPPLQVLELSLLLLVIIDTLLIYVDIIVPLSPAVAPTLIHPQPH